MKKTVLALLLVLCLILPTFAACDTAKEPVNTAEKLSSDVIEGNTSDESATDGGNKNYDEMFKDPYDVFEELTSRGYTGTFEEWVASLTGKDGADGKSAYELAVENGYEGTVEEWLLSLVGAPGEKGDKGDTGATGNGIASVEKTATNGLVDTYTITFTDGSKTTFTVTNGAKGDKGDTGTQGPQGEKGDQGEQGIQGDTGVSVTDSYVDEKLHLWIVLSNGTKIDAGYVGVTTTETATETDAPAVSETETATETDAPIVSETDKPTETEKPDETETGDVTETETASQGLAFTSNGDGTCFVSGIGKCTDLDLVIPSISPEGDSVTSIGDEAFWGSTSLTSIVIPDSVTSIGAYAFDYCDSLTSIVIPDSVTSIGVGAFSCESLEYNEYDNAYYLGNDSNPYVVLVEPNYRFITTCNIHDDTKLIYSFAFWGSTSLTSVTIPDSVTSIGSYAFNGCTSLTSVTIPDSVTSIGDGAFWGSTSLTSVTIPDSVTNIGDGPFSSCDSLMEINVEENNEKYCSIDGNLYSKDVTTLIQYATGKTGTSFTIPDRVTNIGEYAFHDCTNLTNITIGNSVTSIDFSAFGGCTSLTSVTIPDSVTSIDFSAFVNCTSLTSVTIPDSVTSIGDSAFNGCTSLASIEIDETNTNYKSIDGNLYSKEGETLIQYAVGKTATEFTIPDSVMSIGSSAFQDCTNLTNITISNSVRFIDQYAFDGCTSLTSVTIGDSVKLIGYSTFYECTSLTTVNYAGSEEQWAQISIYYGNSSLTSAIINYNYEED